MSNPLARHIKFKGCCADHATGGFMAVAVDEGIAISTGDELSNVDINDLVGDTLTQELDGAFTDRVKLKPF